MFKSSEENFKGINVLIKFFVKFNFNIYRKFDFSIVIVDVFLLIKILCFY